MVSTITTYWLNMQYSIYKDDPLGKPF